MAKSRTFKVKLLYSFASLVIAMSLGIIWLAIAAGEADLIVFGAMLITLGANMILCGAMLDDKRSNVELQERLTRLEKLQTQ